jgi:hypothetical protein
VPCSAISSAGTTTSTTTAVWRFFRQQRCITQRVPGKGEEAIRERAKVLNAAYAAHPERFVNQPPHPEALPMEVWINPPLPVEPSREGSGDTNAAAP